MSKKSYKNSDELLKSIKRRAVTPASQNLFEDQDFLDFATEEIDSHIVQLVTEQQANHFLVTRDIPIVAGKSKYPIHYRATGNKLKDLAFVPVNSNEQVCKMSEVDISEVYDISSYNTNQPYSYYTSSNEICLIPETSNYTGSLRMSFYLRTNALVPMTEVGTITAIDFTLGIITVDSVPEKFLITNKYDFVMCQSPHKIITFDNSITSVNTVTKQITFGTGNLPESLVVGDLCCLGGETGIPNIPSDLHNLVAHRAAARILAAVGDTEALQIAEAQSQVLQKAAAETVRNRIEGSNKKIVNRSGFLNRRGRR